MRNAFVTLLIMGTSGCQPTSSPVEDNYAQADASLHKLAEVQQICEVFTDFRYRNNKWPSTYDEFACFSEQISFTIPSWFQEQYRGHCFKISDEGSIHMEFEIGCEDAEGNDIVCVLPVTLSIADPQVDYSAMLEALKREMQD